jgi:pyruvate/2-oxoglutarate dehydrogenase complex dihydrolipoamide dehydrogenase (E3) component
MQPDCDVIVLGMGTCGEDAALRLAGSGLDVVGIEGRLIGGECPYWACIPSKVMIRSANMLTEARRADGRAGSVSVEPDWGMLASRIRSEVTGGWQDNSAGIARFEDRGGRFVEGWARLTASREVEVNGSTIRARRGVLVATGSEPFIPPIPGLEEVDYWTNREAIETEQLPASLVVLGAGPVGCELGQVFARFGCEVIIIDVADRPLPNEEPEASEVVAGSLAEDGVELRLGVRAESVAADGDSIVVGLHDGSTVTAERLLVATGRKADADTLGVAAAGGSTAQGFIEVDGYLRAADGLWAIGDVTGVAMLTHVAEYQSMIAVEDILGGSPDPADYSVLPRATFTDPEVGGVGMTETAAREAGHDVTVTVKDLRATFRGWTYGVGAVGVIKLVADRDQDRLLGATAVGPSATEVLGFLALAVRERTPLRRLVHTMYAFPTFYGGVGETIGGFARGLVRVLDPHTAPMFDDPEPAP